MNLIKKSFKNLFSNPVVILYSLLMLALQAILGGVFLKVNEKIFTSSSLVHTVWFVGYTLILITLISFCIILMINSLNEKKNKSSNNVFKLSIKNVVLILFTVIIYNLIFFISNWIAFLIGRSISLSVNYAQILFITLLVLGTITLLMFISLSSFFLVKDNSSIIKSIISSIKFVKINYLSVLIVFIAFFFLLELSNQLPLYFIYLFSITEILNYLIIYPLMASVLTTLINSQN